MFSYSFFREIRSLSLSHVFPDQSSCPWLPFSKRLRCSGCDGLSVQNSSEDAPPSASGFTTGSFRINNTFSAQVRYRYLDPIIWDFCKRNQKIMGKENGTTYQLPLKGKTIFVFFFVCFNLWPSILNLLAFYHPAFLQWHNSWNERVVNWGGKGVLPLPTGHFFPCALSFLSFLTRFKY